MPNFKFHDPQNEALASKYFWSRGGVICLAVIGLIIPLMLFGVAGTDFTTEKWIDYPSTEKAPYVCQQAKVGSCPSGWSPSTDLSLCYSYEPIMLNQRSAAAKCEMDVASLAMPKSDSENADIYTLCGKNSPCWIGLSRDENGLFTTWWDGSVVLYTNWADGEPNDVEGNEDGVAVGSGRIAEAIQAAIFIAGITTLASVLVNIIVVSAVCCLLFYALNSKNDGLVCALAGCDGYCAFCVGLGLLQTLVRIMQGQVDPITLMGIILNLMQLVCLVGLAIYGFKLRSGMQREKMANAGQAQPGMVVGQPVQGQVVVGTVVSPAPAAA